MKTFLSRTFTLMLLLSCLMNLSAENIPMETPSVYDQFKEYLADFPQDLVDNENLVQLTFMVTNDSKIVVVSTDNEDLDDFVKSSLNYKSLKNHSFKANEIYILPIRLLKI